MSKTTRNVLISCGVLVLVVCLCLSVLAVGGVGAGLWQRNQQALQPTSTERPTRTPTPTPSPLPPGAPTLTPTPTPEPGAVITDSVPPEIAAQMDEIESQVIRIRGLQPTGRVVRALLSPEALRQKVLDDFFTDYTPEDVRQDALELSLFGLLESNFDLLTFFQELFSEQVAGFYDNETKDMYVVQGESFGGPERMTYSHEYTHVLQDQVYDIRNGLNYSDETCELDTERCAGIQALIEGDASLTEALWFGQYATTQDRREVQQFYSNYSSPVYDSAPLYMQEDFLFPYRYGQEFVSYLYDQGGWDAVDAAYEDVPLSTEQILHPEKYPADKPIQVQLPDFTTTLGAGWNELVTNSMGEWYTYLILAKGRESAYRLPERTARDAAAGWGGDTYQLYERPSDGAVVMVMVTEWDTTKDATEFRDAFRRYATARWGNPTSQKTNDFTWQGEEGVIFFTRVEGKTIWVVAPESATAQAIIKAVLNLP